MGHWSLFRCILRCPLVIQILIGLSLIPQGVLAQPQWGGEVGVYFDEAGTIDTLETLTVGSALEIFVVAFDIEEIKGYEFQMNPSVAPNFFLGKTLYGPDPSDLGSEYEIVARLGACASDPMTMGVNPDSWTLARYDVLYFAPDSDVYFCISDAPSTNGTTPEFVLCDPAETHLGLKPASVDLTGVGPDGCAVAGPTPSYCEDLTREDFPFQIQPGNVQVAPDQAFSLELEGVPHYLLCKKRSTPHIEFLTFHLRWDRSIADLDAVRLGPQDWDWQVSWRLDDEGAWITLTSDTGITTDTYPDSFLWLDMQSASTLGQTNVVVDDGHIRYSDGLEVPARDVYPGSIEITTVPTREESWGALKARYTD